MPSFIHTSLQSAGVTVSPYQWCASSCTTTAFDVAYGVAPRVTMVWVSIPLSPS